MQKEWAVETAKNGSEISITNNQYWLHIGDAFEGIEFSQEKADKLISDANDMCNLLNKKSDKPEPVKPQEDKLSLVTSWLKDLREGTEHDECPVHTYGIDESDGGECTQDKYQWAIDILEEKPKSYPEYTSIISQLTESLSCDADEIEDTVNVLNMTEYWVENKMLDLCEDNDVMRKVLWADFKEFIQKYKPQNLSVEELYVTDKSEEDK